MKIKKLTTIGGKNMSKTINEKASVHILPPLPYADNAAEQQ